MARRVEIGWQSPKTLSECNRYMLDNEIATDVCFEVGPPDGATINIRAHKYMLISRSSVFEAMIFSNMSETRSETEAKIRIVDISAEIFKLLLSFIYCDSVIIDLESAHTVLYAAKKYLLPRLTECCSKYLHSILNLRNVCRILELSATFDVEDLSGRCLRFIADNSDDVLSGDEVLNLSRESLEAILRVDRIMSGPSTLFTSCVKWAKHQLQTEHSIETPNDQQVRKTLGSLLYEIPFPTITVTEFANLVGESDVLTTKEKSAVYYYLGSRRGKDKLKFSSVNRHEHLVNRATSHTKGLWPHSQCSSCGNFKKSTYEITLKTDRNILLTGLGLYAGHNGSSYGAEIQVIQENNSLLQQSVLVPNTENSMTFKVSFDEPVSIAEGKLHRISVLASEAVGYCGELCNEILIDTCNVRFTFDDASASAQSNLHVVSLFGAPSANNSVNSGAAYGCSRCGMLSITPFRKACVAQNQQGFGISICCSVTYGQIPQLYFIPT